MLPEAQAASSTGEKKRGGHRGSGAVTYLKSEMLSLTGTREAKILSVKYEESNRFNDRPSVVLKLGMEGHIVYWRVDVKKNPNYGYLLDAFGRNENDWLNKTILLGLEEDEFYNNPLIRVSFPQQKAARK